MRENALSPSDRRHPGPCLARTRTPRQCWCVRQLRPASVLSASLLSRFRASAPVRAARGRAGGMGEKKKLETGVRARPTGCGCGALRADCRRTAAPARAGPLWPAPRARTPPTPPPRRPRSRPIDCRGRL
eukprot:scaffold4173_cov117-Isochrysis_galbana.AAC.4